MAKQKSKYLLDPKHPLRTLVYILIALGFLVGGYFTLKATQTSTESRSKAAETEQIINQWEFDKQNMQFWIKTNFATGNFDSTNWNTYVISDAKTSTIEQSRIPKPLPKGTKKLRFQVKVNNPQTKGGVPTPSGNQYSGEVRYMLAGKTTWEIPIPFNGKVDGQAIEHALSLPDIPEITLSKLQISFFPLSSKTQVSFDYVRLAAIPLTYKRVFVTSNLYTGSLGGYPGADRKCQESADNVGLGGKWKSWLSDGIEPSAGKRLLHHNGPYVLLDNTVIAQNWSDLTDKTLLHPINLTELKTTVPEVINDWDVWTNTYPDGNVATDLQVVNCRSFHTDKYSPTLTGMGGSSAKKDSQWTGPSRGHTCNTKARLYCFEQ